jgi:hypothetical protein
MRCSPWFFNKDLLNLGCYWMWFPESCLRVVLSILLHHSMILITEVLLHDSDSFLRLCFSQCFASSCKPHRKLYHSSPAIVLEHYS